MVYIGSLLIVQQLQKLLFEQIHVKRHQHQKPLMLEPSTVNNHSSYCIIKREIESLDMHDIHTYVHVCIVHLRIICFPHLRNGDLIIWHTKNLKSLPLGTRLNTCVNVLMLIHAWTLSTPTTCKIFTALILNFPSLENVQNFFYHPFFALSYSPANPAKLN